MQRIFSSVGGQFRQIEQVEPGSWISLTYPTREELDAVALEFGIDPDDLRAPLDTEERSRIDVENGYVLILVDVPTTELRGGKPWWVTIPLGIILTNDVIITTCLELPQVLADFEAGLVRDAPTNMRTRFTLQLLLRNAGYYLQYLRRIDKQSDEIQAALRRATRNEELIQMLEIEKSLVYFSTSLTSNERVLQRLARLDAVKKYPDDDELLEDTIVENQQAIEMAQIYSGILSGTMDAFASVIANNQNDIMKTLALATIIMSIPTMIFSAYGMNVAGEGMPFSTWTWGFFIIIGLSFAVSLCVLVFFLRKRWF
ncbi:MAG: magnesium transporter CorA family protein [Propionibacteriaceae bacterium]|jgi:magnesium transporter|nr:magnesium transporter CorA family protein [Propionibacteriaceae bacterium]